MPQTRIPTPWRRLAIVSFLTLVLALVLWNVAAYAIDSSELDQGPDSSGMTFGSSIATVVYGGLPLIVSLVAVLVAALGGTGKARGGAWCIAVLSALCGAGLAVVAFLTLEGPAAEQVFGGASLVLALVLLTPARALCPPGTALPERADPVGRGHFRRMRATTRRRPRPTRRAVTCSGVM